MPESNKLIDEIRARLSLARIAAKSITWDNKKTNASKGDYWACCPFHNEKTPSFHVSDKKGFYHCFGCQESGDVFKFVQTTRGWRFRETLEYLAREAGVQLPAYSSEDAKKEEQNRSLTKITEAAADFFRIQLATSAGSAAREYLAGRGISERAQKLFEIGFAPNRRSDLFRHLINLGYSAERIILAGLSARHEDGDDPYDRFRNRIIFPIRDLQNQVIGFGGRAMDPNDHAKYLNSPETPIFSKGSSLYNILNAQKASAKNTPLIVAEGYLDVIALSEAGFEASVAPLGTAVTESQLLRTWRLSGRPVIALDGDKAGLDAARRLVNLALPFLSPGQTLRFCVMPENLDPDDVIRQHGKLRMQQMIERALPLSEFLWWSETRNRRFDTPERLAELQATLDAAIAKIKDANLKKTYRQFASDKIWEQFGRRSGARGLGRKPPGTGMPTQEALTSYLAHGEAENAGGNLLREGAVLAICLSNPSAIDGECLQRLERLEMESDEHSRILYSLLKHLEACGNDVDTLKNNVSEDVGSTATARLFSARHICNIRSVQTPGNVTAAKRALDAELARLESIREAKEEIAHFIEDLKNEKVGEEGYKRMIGAIRKRDDVFLGYDDFDSSEYELSPKNGLPIRRSALEKLDDLSSRPLSGS